MVLDAMRIHWHCANVHRNGRRGQRQNGVDIYGQTISGWIAAQAKNSETVTIRQIRDEIYKAHSFQPPLTELHFAISGNRDSLLQNEVRSLVDEKIDKNSFSIFIHFFEDICCILSSRPELVIKYWGSFSPSLLQQLSNVLSDNLKSPITDIDTVVKRIYALPQFEALSRQISEVSGGSVRAVIRVDNTPLLEFEAGSIERSWIIAIVEQQPQLALTMCRIAVDIDSGKMLFFSILENRWIEYHEWLRTQQWFI